MAGQKSITPEAGPASREPFLTPFAGLLERARPAAAALVFRGDDGFVTLAGLFERVLVAAPAVGFVGLLAGLCDRPRTPAPLARRGEAGFAAGLMGLLDRARDTLSFRVPPAGLSRRLGALLTLGFPGLADLTRVVGGASLSSLGPESLEISTTSAFFVLAVFAAAFVAGFFGLALVLVTFAGDAFFHGLPRGFGDVVVDLFAAGEALFLGRPLGLGEAAADFAGDVAFLIASDFALAVSARAFLVAGIAAFFGEGDFALLAAPFLVAGEDLVFLGDG